MAASERAGTMFSPRRRSAFVGMAAGMLLVEHAAAAQTSTSDPSRPALNRAAVQAFDAACRGTAPIRGRADLEAWLPTASLGPDSPLAPLSPGGRRRFLASLVFHDGDLIGIDTADLEAELTLSQACRVLALFGRQGLIVNLPEARIETDDDRAVAAWRALLAQAS